MFENSKLYAMKDDGSTGMKDIEEYSVQAFNDDKWGIFFAVNQFDGPRRLSNLTKINAWYAETDGIDKATVLRTIEKSPLEPSVLVESKNGFHMYWLVEGDCDLLDYRKVQDWLADFFDGDRLKDATRVMRLPGTRHWKNPTDPFEVRLVKRNDDLHYTLEQMTEAFSNAKTSTKRSGGPSLFSRPKKPFRKAKGGWKDRMKSLDVKSSLERLSGTSAVKGDVYEFSENPNGTLQICVNGKRSSSWIDHRGKIGSHKRFGPDIYTWTFWYWRSPEKVKEIYDEYFGGGGE